MTRQLQHVPDGSDYLTPRQVATKLQVGEPTVIRWLNRGLLRGVKFGGRRLWRISRQEIERFEKGER